jgi:UDP-N-acetylmuramate: L-alanyl-gamma-D-glutamyl-meso-diaminopimelate ligase
MKIHILGICGTFMGGVARLARALGHDVTGADANVYPPMSTQLLDLGVAVDEGYEVSARLRATELVIVGNALSRGNPSVEYVLNERLPYCSGPAWLAEHVLARRRVIAVAGTHGKTTTSSMIAWLLESAGLRPGFLIGGVPQNFGVSARLGDSELFVIEADEYDSAFFDKRSKFLHYRPQLLVLNNLEFDHADIFADLAAIERQFEHLLRTVPANGLIIANHADAALARVRERGCWTKVETFGAEAGATWRCVAQAPDHSAFEILLDDRSWGSVRSSVYGAHNALNATAAIAAAHRAGASAADCRAGLAGFRNANRRLELLGEAAGIALYDDFAHHPTAIAATLAALRARVGTARIIAVLEARSATMRRGVHAATLADALAEADASVLYQAPDASWDMHAATASLGARRTVLPSIDAILDHLRGVLRRGDQVLVMSNGGFGGLHGRIMELLRERA